MLECIFCNIINGKIRGEFVYQDEEIAAFRDIDPKAPVHILIVPRKHISTLNDLGADSELLVGKLITRAQKIAVQEGIDESGYRLVFNCNRDAGQEIFHIHLHLLGGRRLNWPPG